MTPRTAAWIVLAGLVVIAGCQRGSAPAPAADATATSASAPDPSTSTVYMCPMDKDIRAHGRLTFEVTDPWKGNPVTKYSVIHEKLFHAFLVSEDLDFYPEAATPQLLAQTLVVPGPSPAPARLTRDEAPKQTENMTVSARPSPGTVRSRASSTTAVPPATARAARRFRS